MSVFQHMQHTTGCFKKKATLNVHEYLLCFTIEKTFGDWDLGTIVIV